MKGILILGVCLIIAGAAMLAYGQFRYRTQETVLEIGPIKATAERERTVPFPPIIGWLLVAGGAGVLVFGVTRAKA